MSRQPSSQSSSSISTEPNKTDPNRAVEFDEAEFARRLAGDWSNGERLSIAHSVKEYLTDRVAQGAAASGQSLLPESRGDTARAEAADTARANLSPSGSTLGTSPEVVWSRLQAELRDFAEQESAMWGGVDECLLARYLAGECTDEEERKIEQAAKDHPAVQECLDLVREVMTDEEINALPLVVLDVPKVRPDRSKPEIPVFLQAKAEAPSVVATTTHRTAPRATLSNWVTAAALLLAIGSTSLHFADKVNFGKDPPQSVAPNPKISEVADLEARLANNEKQLAAVLKQLADSQLKLATREDMQRLLRENLVAMKSEVPSSQPRPYEKPELAAATLPIERESKLIADSVRGQRIGDTAAGCIANYSGPVTHTVMKPAEGQPVNAPVPAVANAERLSAFRLETIPLAQSDTLPLLPLPDLVDAAQAWQKNDSPFLPLAAKALRKELGDPTQWPQELIDAILALEKDPSKAAAFVLTGKIDLKGATQLSAVVDRFKNSDKPALRAAAMALAGEIDSKGTIELPAVIDGLKSRNKLERWAAVAALSETWRSSCGLFVVVPQDVPQGTTLSDPHNSLPNTQSAQSLRPVPEQRFAQANVAMKATPTLTVFKPVFESLTPVPTRSSPAPKQKLLADGMREDQPSPRSTPRTYSAPEKSAPRYEYEEPATPAPGAIQTYTPVRQHPLAAKADELVPQLMKLLDSNEDPLVRRTALHVIADFGAKALPARQSLERILKDDAEAVVSRRWAAYAIGRIGPEARESFGILVGCLIAEKDASVLTAACFAISELARGEKPLLEIERNLASTQLSSLLADHADPQVRRWAAFALDSVSRPQQAQGDVAPPNYVPRTTSFPLKSNTTARHTNDASDSTDGSRGR